MTDIELPAVNIRMLGTFEVVRADGVVPVFRTRKTKWLLAFLALQQGRAVEFGLLNKLFWLDGGVTDTSKTAETSDRDSVVTAPTDEFMNVRASLANLRKVLSPRRLTKPSRQSVALEMNDLSLDLVDFDVALREGTLAALRMAVDLYTGDLLADCDEAWVEAWVKEHRDRRRQKFIEALQKLAENSLASGDFEGAERFLRRLTAAEPWREEWIIQLVRVLLKRGEPEGAREVCSGYLAQDPKITLVPGSELDRLYQTLRHTQAEAIRVPAIQPSAITSLAYEIPYHAEVLIGRETEVAESAARLTFARMLTLIGPPGVGKTQLALRLCAQVSADYPDGTPFVDLATARNLRDVERKLLSSLRVARRREMSDQETLANFLAPKRMLLVLDNCEHLVEAITPAIKQLLVDCPGLRLLTTSQVAWPDVAAQSVTYVKGLATPIRYQDTYTDAELDALRHYDAIQLYLREASAVWPEFTMTPENAPAIVQLCHYLDGLPLGIKLAASHAQVRSPAETLAALIQNPMSLRATRVDPPPRRQSLWSAIAASFDLLPANLQHSFICLAVFRGGWTVRAAVAVVGSSQGTKSDQATGSNQANGSSQGTGSNRIEEDLRRLMNHSLIIGVPHQEPPRFRMLQMIHRYAEERLRQRTDFNDVCLRHLTFYLQFAEEMAEAMKGPEQDRALDRLELDWSNLEAALEWAATTGHAEQGLQLACALWRYCHARGNVRGGIAWFDRLLAASPHMPVTLHARALNALGNLTFQNADYARARVCYTEQLAVEARAGNRTGMAGAHGNLGNIALMTGDAHDAEHHFQHCREIFIALGEERGLSFALGNLALLACQIGDFALACHYHNTTVDLLRGKGDNQGLITALNNLAYTQMEMKCANDAAKSLAESLDLCVAATYRPGFVQCLFLHAGLALLVGMMETAARFMGASRAVRETSGLAPNAQAVAEQRQRCEAIRAYIGTASLDCAMDEGRIMSVTALVAMATELYDRIAADTPSVGSD